MDIKQSIVGILAEYGSPHKFLGTGFLVEGGFVLTCAHLVNKNKKEGDIVQFKFEGHDQVCTGKIDFYSPENDLDIVILKVTTTSLPDSVAPLQLTSAKSSNGHVFFAFGYPQKGNYDGLHGTGKILGLVTNNNGRHKLQCSSTQVTHGYSGSPILDETHQMIVGMVSSGLENDLKLDDKLGDAVFATPVDILKEVYSQLIVVESNPEMLNVVRGQTLSETSRNETELQNSDTKESLTPDHNIGIAGNANQSTLIAGYNNQITINNITYLHEQIVLPEKVQPANRDDQNPQKTAEVPTIEKRFLSIPLIGRNSSLDWLQKTKGDRLLLGQPSSGKTFLLHKLVQESKGLFLKSKDGRELNAELRAQMPNIILVDDAVHKQDLLMALKDMRDEGMSFDIIITGWLGEKDELMQVLSLPSTQVHILEQLTRPEIIDVIHKAEEELGIVCSDRLRKEIVDQAEGRPGLAVTLTWLCSKGGVPDVLQGDSLINFILSFAKQFDKKSGYILAVLSLAGNQGMLLDKLSQILKIEITDLHQTVNLLITSGVVLPIRENQLTVRPPILRYTLVRNVFFAGVGLPIEPILMQMPIPNQAEETLMGARRQGANIPDSLLRPLLDNPKLWENYAWLGQSEAEWAFEQSKDSLQPIAFAGLVNAPTLYLPAMLTASIEDKRPLNTYPDHFLRIIEDWIKSADPETNTGVNNRQTLLSVLESWLESGGNWNVGGQALRYVMSPHFENSSTDSGIGRTVTIRYGVLSLENLKNIKRFWSQILNLLANIEINDWHLVQELVEDWSYPGRLGKSIPHDIYDDMKLFAEQMLHDVIELARENPGVIHWAKELAENCGYNLKIEIDNDFQILYPLQSRDEDLEEQSNKWNVALLPLVHKWITENPETVAKHLAHIEHEAQIANITWPRLTPAFCSELAKETSDGLLWVKVFQSAKLPGDLIHPFLQKCMEIQEEGWDEFFTENIDEPSLQGSIIPLILTSSNPPQELLDLVLQKLDSKWAQWLQLVCMRQVIPEKHMPFLLQHGNIAIAFAAAEGEWSAKPEGVVRASLRKDWEAVIVQYHPSDLYGNSTFWLSKILTVEPELSYRWLENLLAEKDKHYSSFALRNPIKAALMNLSLDSRLKILELVPNRYGFDTLILDLINRSPDIYKHLLNMPHLKEYHLVSLSGMLDDIWSELATLASKAGYTPDDIAAATMREYSDTLTNMDGEAEKWSNWIKKFEKISSSDNELFKKIGNSGCIIARRNFDDNERRLRKDAVYGWD